MTVVSITELKKHLSMYLRRAQAGERLHVTYRGVEVAELGPPDPVRAALWRMVAGGTAEWSGGKPRLADQPVPVNGASVSDAVIEDRRSRQP
jgi:prevent-host-death family protein